MSKINNSANISINNELYLRNRESAVVKTETKAAVEIETRTNSDSSHATFCSREGIDRGAFRKAGLGRGLGHAKVGSDTDFIDERGNKKKGKVLKDCGDYQEVFFEGQVYLVDKKTGKSRGHRKATEAEMAQYQQMQQAQEQEQQRQAQQAEARRDEVKAEQRKYDMKVSSQKAEQQKLTIKKTESKKLEQKIHETKIFQKINQTQSVADKFNVDVARVEHETLSVTTALRIEENNEKLKNGVK